MQPNELFMRTIENFADITKQVREYEQRVASETSASYNEVISQRIEDIMDEFDFDRVHRVMEFLNWTWADEFGGVCVPLKSEVRKRARALLNESAKSKESLSTGGFHVEFREGTEHETKWVNLNLTFNVEFTSFDGEYYKQPN